ncbi:MAG: hypothetical protein LBD99_04710, partial [Candidatus Margulisbacteria bacterium]|nr:hypothetical protein [Candidatus Margulisiibacteriota bacterium]
MKDTTLSEDWSDEVASFANKHLSTIFNNTNPNQQITITVSEIRQSGATGIHIKASIPSQDGIAEEYFEGIDYVKSTEKNSAGKLNDVPIANQPEYIDTTGRDNGDGTYTVAWHTTKNMDNWNDRSQGALQSSVMQGTLGRLSGEYPDDAIRDTLLDTPIKKDFQDTLQDLVTFLNNPKHFPNNPNYRVTELQVNGYPPIEPTGENRQFTTADIEKVFNEKGLSLLTQITKEGNNPINWIARLDVRLQGDGKAIVGEK